MILPTVIKYTNDKLAHGIHTRSFPSFLSHNQCLHYICPSIKYNEFKLASCQSRFASLFQTSAWKSSVYNWSSVHVTGTLCMAQVQTRRNTKQIIKSTFLNLTASTKCSNNSVFIGITGRFNLFWPSHNACETCHSRIIFLFIWKAWY